MVVYRSIPFGTGSSKSASCSSRLFRGLAGIFAIADVSREPENCFLRLLEVVKNYGITERRSARPNSDVGPLGRNPIIMTGESSQVGSIIHSANSITDALPTNLIRCMQVQVSLLDEAWSRMPSMSPWETEMRPADVDQLPTMPQERTFMFFCSDHQVYHSNQTCRLFTSKL